jgi:HlyD family secretion protein
MKAPAPLPSSLRTLLGGSGEVPLWRRPVLWIALVLLLAAIAGAWFWQSRREAQARPRYTTETVQRGNLSVRVTANGTLQPTNKVDVGSELSGTVAQVFVDVNDKVDKGQVLAMLDTSKLRDQVARSAATVGVAQANLHQARATVEEATGNLQRLQDVSRLSGGKVPSASELATARATLARAQGAVASAQASLRDAGAALRLDQTNLRKASIRSPISGVVLARNVDPGNAVAASLQAVTLFTLAEDLTRMKLEVSVDEADVGMVRDGETSTFTVSAYPTRNYPATVTRVSYGSTTKDNVVTYQADLEVNNADLSLRPGMSATATILAAERSNVLLVPNAALRFTPTFGVTAPAAASGGITARLLPRMPRQNAPRRAGTTTSAARQVWVLQDGSPTPVAVQPGMSDGRMTEVQSESLVPGMAVIVEQQVGAAK